MLLSLNGVRFINKKTYAICYIENFSEDLKTLIRSELSTICHGVSKVSRGRKRYNYKNTLKSFLERYETKSDETKVGMIGELLTHVIIIRFLDNFNIVSPFFNMEEKSITKGFDIILYSKNNHEIWITEVKSGEIHKGKDSNSTNKELLNTAKLNLKNRLNQNEISLWDNAINKATIVLESFTDTKEAVLEILEEICEEVIEERAKSEDKNVILVTCLFANLNDEIKEQVLNDFHITTLEEKLFNKLFVLSLQKNTYQKIYQFLKDEAKI